MAAHAVLVENRLDQERVRYWIAAVSIGLQGRSRSPEGGGHGRACRQGPETSFMTALAGESGRAGHGEGGGHHRLHGRAVSVERLEKHRLVRRQEEVCTAVRVHRHRAKGAASILIVVE